MKTTTISMLITILLIGVATTFWFSIKQKEDVVVACTMDAKICPDGSAVGRTGPNCEFTACPTPLAPAEIADLIVVETPRPKSIIASPVTIEGKARGTWFFEASFPITVVDWDGLIIGQGIAQAKSDWMTEDFVPFTATINFTVPIDTPYRRGTIILKKDNPSGLPEHDNALEIPVNF